MNKKIEVKKFSKKSLLIAVLILFIEGSAVLVGQTTLIKIFTVNWLVHLVLSSSFELTMLAILLILYYFVTLKIYKRDLKKYLESETKES